MLNYIWAFMIIIGVVYGAATGNISDISNGFIDSSKEAVTLCITMLGIVSFWSGIMEVATQSGIIGQMTRLISPLVNFLFPGIPKNHKSREHITTNIIANILGLGWAATPAGLRAMESLTELEEERREGLVQMPEAAAKKKPQKPGTVEGMPCGIASNEMCTFLILNISSLQLIPVNIIAYRSQYGSVNPTAIVGPGILATAVSTAVAIVFCKVMDRKRRV